MNHEPNPILEEVWKTKDELAREANDDLHQLRVDTRRWAKEHPHPGTVIHNADELQQFIAEQERRDSDDELPKSERQQQRSY